MADTQRQDPDAQTESEAIRHSLKACNGGRVHPFADFAAEMRAMYDLPTHLSNEELTRSL